jgi:hypothetical protein
VPPKPYSGPSADPFKRVAPDGQTYFDIIGLVGLRNLIATYDQAAQAVDLCKANAARSIDPRDRAYWNRQAQTLVLAIQRFQQSVDKIAIDTAAVANNAARKWVNATQARPAGAERASAVLASAVQGSRAVPTSLSLGIVGVADVSRLDSMTQKGAKGTSYWEAQEFGTDAHVGRIVRGFFMPGRSRPSGAQFRVHPEFQPGKGPEMRIQRPIEERGFLRRASDDAFAYWHRRMAAPKARLMREIVRVASNPPPSVTTARAVRP